MMTRHDVKIDRAMFTSRMGTLVNQFFKILPLKESGEPTLTNYMNSLQREMLGYDELILALRKDDLYLSLLAILEYLIDHECDTAVVRSEVFKAIRILELLKEKYEKEVPA